MQTLSAPRKGKSFESTQSHRMLTINKLLHIDWQVRMRRMFGMRNFSRCLKTKNVGEHMNRIDPNSGQGQGAARRMTVNNPRQEAMANAVKSAASAAIDGGCHYAKKGSRAAAESSCRDVPEVSREMAVEHSANRTGNAVKNVVDRSIDSNYCYGNPDSSVSRVSRWFS